MMTVTSRPDELVLSESHVFVEVLISDASGRPQRQGSSQARAELVIDLSEPPPLIYTLTLDWMRDDGTLLSYFRLNSD
jgi:hypothetical protein